MTDENDQRPTFSEAKYIGYIPTNAKPGLQVLQVFAADFDSGLYGRVVYAIIGNTYGDTFSIGSSSGIITLKKPIALIDTNKFTLTLTAKDVSLGGQAIVELYAVTQEGPPKFALSKFTFNVTENNKPSEAIGVAKAISLDLLKYTIVRGNDNNTFSIDPRSGELKSIESLDAEAKSQYLLFVRATDLSERYAEASVEVNVRNINDNGPLFRSAVNGLIEVVKSRKLATGQEIINVEGYDLDVGDSLSYKINSVSARGYFQIDQDGLIKSLKSLQTLATDTNRYQFEVVATDSKGKQNSVQIRIVLVNRPGDPFTRTVSEGRKLNSGPFITDLDFVNYPKAEFKIVYPNTHPFKIDSATGHISLRRQIDYETVKEYTIYVEEADPQKSSEYTNYEVRIKVIDENDNKPKFTMKNLFGKVNKNAQPGTTVFKLTAKDPDGGDNGKIYFQLKGSDPFSIDPVTNEIKTSGFYLTQDWYNITVQAYDKGRPQLSSDVKTIYIKTGDNPPEFKSYIYKFTVDEGAQGGKVIGKVDARSLSGISIQYSIEGGNQDNVFTIDSYGQILLQGNLDYESGQTSYSLTVQAAEISTQPLTSTTNILIEVTNINDNAPEFTQVEYRSQPISENVPIGSTLILVSATDCDCSLTCKCAGGLLTYSLESYKDTFKIDHVTGEIKNIRALDYDTMSEYRFQVKVHDTGENPQTGVADVVITLSNVNDNTPTFDPDYAVVSMTENVDRGTIVITVQAQDADKDDIKYAIEAGDKLNFEIGEKTGVVRIKSKPTKEKYVFNISASDGVNKGYYTLTVLIEDVNDNSPTFRRCSSYTPIVLEHSPINTPVIKVTATDTDRGRNGEIEYEIQEPQKRDQTRRSSDFKINNATGELTTNKVFDREEKSSYIVLVIALDGGHGRSPAERNSASCQLEIQIQDINDYAPVFSVQNYDISIAENTDIDTVVLEVSAQDKDEGKNAIVTYSISQAALTPNFKIDPTTGAISVAQSLVQKEDRYSFQVKATDGGSPSRSATIEIVINVQPSNPPKFGQLSYSKTLREDTKPGTIALTVNAVSRAQGDTEKKIYYSILPGNLPSTNKPASFTVDSNTGAIKVAKVLDYETLKGYVLTVSAIDQRGMKSNAKVYIYIEDVNDNTPIFVLSKYVFGKVAEGKYPGQVVEQVNATDADSGKFGEVIYSLKQSDESDMFSIDPITGKITTKVMFDREVTPTITFNVEAQDQDPVNPLSATVYVTIQVTDVNDNKPEFKKTRYDVAVDENVRIDHIVAEIQAEDKDAGENARLNYYIIAGNEKGYFGTKSIHRADGGSVGFVTVTRKLDREDKDKFVLKIVASDSTYSAETTVYITVTIFCFFRQNQEYF